jgi:hypothetical protein
LRVGFPHSEILGSTPICRLPEAYRRLSRPSSPVIAKASTTCTYSLDPITLPPLSKPFELQGILVSARCALHPFKYGVHDAIHNPGCVGSHQDNNAVPGASITPPSTSRIFKEPICPSPCGNRTSPTSEEARRERSDASLSYAFFMGSTGGADRDRTGDPLLAKQVLSQLSYSPDPLAFRSPPSPRPQRWWVWMDSNHRPPPYQDGALTN